MFSQFVSHRPKVIIAMNSNVPMTMRLLNNIPRNWLVIPNLFRSKQLSLLTVTFIKTQHIAGGNIIFFSWNQYVLHMLDFA
jgi:hypothetical protein